MANAPSIADMNIYERLVQLRRDMPPLQQDGKNDFQHYKYISADNLVQHLRPYLNKYNLLIVPSGKFEEASSNGKQNHIIITMTYTIVCADKPDQICPLTIVSSGMDTSDKSVFKALTGAFKYAMFQLLQVGSMPDAEIDDGGKVWERDLADHIETTEQKWADETPKPKPKPKPATTKDVEEAFPDAEVSEQDAPGDDEWPDFEAEEMTLQFGKHRGKRLADLPGDWCAWAIKNLPTGDNTTNWDNIGTAGQEVIKHLADRHLGK
jgi:hypothetical protein